MFATVDLTRIESALRSARGWTELAIIAICAVAGWFVEQRVRAARARRAPAVADAGAATPSFSDALFPLLSLGLLYVARMAYRHFAPPFLIDIALPLLLALAGIRLLVDALRRLFPRQKWLPSWERAITYAALLLLVLHYTGILPDVAEDLDAMHVPIGSARVSVLAMIKGATIVIVTLVVTLWLSGLIEARLMKSAPLEGNLKVVLSRVVRALLLLVAILLSLQAVGIDLTVLSVFGGALGVGIGLGLQKLASNYIAGFTILIDRSVRIGDLVTVDGRHGTVADVTTRYVVVRSLDGVEAIVPNETLVTTTVLNYSHTSKDVRVAISVQVAYDSDVDKALELLEQAAREEARVLATPGPRAFVTRFADSGIELELGAWINDPEAGQGDLKSAFNRRVLSAFRAHGIQIPYPQREVRLIGVEPGPTPAPPAA